MMLVPLFRRIGWMKTKYAQVDGDSRSDTDVEDTGLLDHDILGEKMHMTPRALLQRRRPFWQSGVFMVSAHVALLLVYGMILVAVTKGGATGTLKDIGLPYSPAVEALQYHEQKFVLEDHVVESGLFVGKPRPELDQAWHDLLEPQNIWLEKQYMQHYEREDIGVAIPEGGGYIATLNVYHELHCLKRLHQFMYPEYYFADLTPHQIELNRLHNEHCIEFLRKSAMCHGDVGLITYGWVADSRVPLANATTHQCVNWPKLDSWVKSRTVNMLKPNWLVHPTMGIAYPNGEVDRIGTVESLEHTEDEHHH